MTQEQIINAIKKLKAYYPYYYNNISKDDAKAIVEVWKDNFNDLDNEYMTMAINEWGANQTKPPSIAELRKKIGSFYHLLDKKYKEATTEEETQKVDMQRKIIWGFLSNH